MSGRSLILPLLIAGAVAAPYVVEKTRSSPVGGNKKAWDSIMGTVGSSGRLQPGATSTPIPPLLAQYRAGHYGSAMQGPSAQSAVLPSPAHVTASRVGSATMQSDPYALPPGATATPWVPTHGSQPVGGVPYTGRNGLGVPANGQYVTGSLPSGYMVRSPYHTVPNAHVSPSATGMVSPPQQQFERLFQFDLTPDWIVQHWPRVTSQVSEHAYTGLRVPIVSGTTLQDLAGSLTYYFDANQQMQKIAFLGTTGDPSRLVQIATSQYEMTNVPVPNGNCFVKNEKGKPTAILRIRRSHIIRADQPLQRYRVVLELNRPDSQGILSDANQQLLENDRRLLEVGRNTLESRRKNGD